MIRGQGMSSETGSGARRGRGASMIDLNALRFRDLVAHCRSPQPIALLHSDSRRSAGRIEPKCEPA